MSKSTSYWRAFLRHPYNQTLVFAAAAAAVLASFPFGWDGMALVLLGLAAVEIVGLAVVPELPPFKAAVDKHEAHTEREAWRARLLQEIRVQGSSNHLQSYEKMCVRVQSLYGTATDTSTTLTQRDVEQLDLLTVDYLGMCLSDALLKAEEGSESTASITSKLKAVEQKLARGELGAEQAQQLNGAKAAYEETLARQERMFSRRAALEATLVAMPVRMEEVYQMVMTAPRAGNLSALLEESVSKLRVAEEVALGVEEAFGITEMRSGPARHADPAAARAARQAVAGRE